MDSKKSNSKQKIVNVNKKRSAKRNNRSDKFRTTPIKKAKKKSLMNVEDVVAEIADFRGKIVVNRQLPLKEEYKVVVTFNEIEKQLRAARPKRKKLEKSFDLILKIFTTAKLSKTAGLDIKDCIDNVNEIKKGVDNVMAILCS